MKRKPTETLARKQGVFVLFPKWIRRERFQIFRNIRPNFLDQYTKKTDPETFLFWVNDIFAKKQALGEKS